MLRSFTMYCTTAFRPIYYGCTTHIPIYSFTRIHISYSHHILSLFTSMHVLHIHTCIHTIQHTYMYNSTTYMYIYIYILYAISTQYMHIRTHNIQCVYICISDFTICVLYIFIAIGAP